MNISIITSYTNPTERMDPWEEAINCYEEFADEVIVLGENFKTEFEFSDFGPMFDEGFEKLTEIGLKMDIDTLIHEKTLRNFAVLLRTTVNIGISLRKFQFFTPKDFIQNQEWEWY